MKKILISLAAASALSTAAFAESVIVDFSAGGGSISMDKPTFKVGDAETTAVDMTLNEPSQSYTWAQFDHAIPVIPNIRIEQTEMKYSGTATAGLGSFNGVNITADATATVDLSNQDIIAYWGVPFSTWLPMIDEADFGIGVKEFDGKIVITGATDETVDAMLPYGYAKLHITPPFLGGLGIEAEIKIVSGGGASFNESIYKLDWAFEAPIPVIDLEIGIEGGYRSTTFKYDADGSDAFIDVEFTGVFFGLFAKFGI